MSEFKWPGQQIEEEINRLEQIGQQCQDPVLRESTLNLAASLRRQREAQIRLAENEARLYKLRNQQKRQKRFGLF